MANPFLGVLLNNQYYNFVPGSYSETRLLKNSTSDMQRVKNFSVLGAAPIIHTITLVLENSYAYYDATTNNLAGSTAGNGLAVTRKQELESFIGAAGVSMPILFVSPYGSTHLIVPTGTIDSTPFIPEAPEATGVEWRVNLTLEDLI